MQYEPLCKKIFVYILCNNINTNYRHNARRYDLNRNFPDFFKANTKQAQPETEAVKEWISKIQFVLSGSLHGGALVASYPFDNTPSSSKYDQRSYLSFHKKIVLLKHIMHTFHIVHNYFIVGMKSKLKQERPMVNFQS